MFSTAAYTLIIASYTLIIAAKFHFTRLNRILIREIWDAYLVVSFANVTWSYIFRIVILSNGHIRTTEL